MKELTIKEFASIGNKAMRAKYTKEQRAEWCSRGGKKSKKKTVDKSLASKKKIV